MTSNHKEDRRQHDTSNRLPIYITSAQRQSDDLNYLLNTDHYQHDAYKKSEPNINSSPERKATPSPAIEAIDSSGTHNARIRSFRPRYISKIKADELTHAAKIAYDMGKPLNRFITLNWEALGIERNSCGNATSAFLKEISDGLRKRGVRTAYIYTHEVGAIVGCHAHILIHIPKEHQKWSNKATRRARGKLTNRKRLKGGHKSVSVSGGASSYPYNYDTYLDNLERVVTYILKDSVFDEIGVESAEKSLTFKVAGMSQNLNQR